MGRLKTRPAVARSSSPTTHSPRLPPKIGAIFPSSNFFLICGFLHLRSILQWHLNWSGFSEETYGLLLYSVEVQLLGYLSKQPKDASRLALAESDRPITFVILTGSLDTTILQSK